uniref:ABC transporter ATP-binding protein n=1 Tax=Enterocloster hominis (ex Hitch et al. 2024) TaxID=1917870 RepID=UPI001030B46D|nr:ABC transporter ATP-binding protein [Lachnoclostridium pacaense]
MNEKTKKFLSVRGLDVVYTSGRKTVHAVNGISFDMDKGETLALVGETGAGKTTIAKAILGILPNPPARLRSGEIILEGEDLLKKPEEEMLKIRGEKIAMIFQDPMTALNPIMTVGEQIVEGLLLHNGYTRKEAEEEAANMLEMVGIPAERFGEYPFEFSGGMKQRVVIAMALACSPDLLLADEPTTALDVTIQAQVLDLIKDLKCKYNTSMLLITHDLGVVAETSDYVAVIYAGQILEYGSKEAVFLHPSHPYTIGLFQSLPGMNTDVRRLKPIAGSPPDPTDLPEGCAFAPRCPHAKGGCGKGEIEFREIAPGHFCRCGLKHKED